MNSDEIRRKFLAFYAKQGHAIIPSAPLIPINDPTTLFTGSGMQPLIPFLLGQKHPDGTRLADSQKSFRSGDIEDVGDNRHTTFFEMLGNWSLGDYFKNEQLPWVFSFLINEIGFDPKKIYVTTFIGDDKNAIPKDTDAAAIWKDLFLQKGIEAKEVSMGSEENASKIGMQGGRIFYYDAKKNWWSRAGIPEKMPAGEPGGPDSEIFYEFESVVHDTKFGEHCHPNCDCGKFIEIGNSVFMEYKKNTDGTFSKLAQKNVDFGGGLERMAMCRIDSPDIFAIDCFKSLLTTLEVLSGKKYNDPEFTKAFRIIADHIRSSVFLIGDGVIPSNSDQGYFVRRLLRRAIRYWDKLGIPEEGIARTVDSLLEHYKESYPATYAKKAEIKIEIAAEEEKFRKTLKLGLAQLKRELAHNVDINEVGNPGKISGEKAFDLYQSYGFPIELTIEIAKENSLSVDIPAYETEMKKHQDLSRSGSEKKFKGGLSDTSEMSLKYHTATHLLHQALRTVLGDHVGQKGSNITPERLRFDFTHATKMTDEEKKKVEDLINTEISAALPVTQITLTKDEAEKTGALHFFGEKYGDQVSVYYIGSTLSDAFSKEFCGGPHVTNTSTLGKFKIQKEEAVSAGVRRIKAVLE